MFPFVDLKFIKIPMYGINLVVGGLLAGTIAYFLCKKLKKEFLDFIIISTLMLAFGFVFAKILYLLVAYPLKEIPGIILSLLSNTKNPEFGAGFVFYGGIIGAVGGYFLGSKIAGCKINEFSSIYTFVLPFVHSFGRIGCFCAGCCYGIRYDGPFAVHYDSPISSVEPGVGIFPVQLLEALLLFIFSITVLILLMKNKKISIFYYALFYSVIRFGLEFLRGDIERGKIFMFTTSQWISIFIFVAAVLMLGITELKKFKK